MYLPHGGSESEFTPYPERVWKEAARSQGQETKAPRQTELTQTPKEKSKRGHLTEEQAAQGQVRGPGCTGQQQGLGVYTFSGNLHKLNTQKLTPETGALHYCD